MNPVRWAAIVIAFLVLPPGADARLARVVVSVVPRTSFADQPFHVRVTGLQARSSAELRLRVRDARGRMWQSSASFRADARGVVDADRAVARSGSYRGRWGMGLFASLTTPTRASFYRFDPAGARSFRVDVRAGSRPVASRTFRRVMPGTVVEQSVSIADAGFYGVYHVPQGPAAPSPAILLLGGSEGGLPILPGRVSMLAARGYPTLGVAYFRAPGLPQTLARIPLEYFERALTWLRAQPQVDPSRIVVIGVSRGSEAAQLLGVYYPDLVSGVVAAVPSNVALCGFPDCSQPAWMFQGSPLPYTQQFSDPYPTDNPAAVIPDERIRGPVFTVCGGRDLVWLSCQYARAIAERLRAFGHPYGDVSYAYPRAGHSVGGFVPYSPVAPRALYLRPDDERAREAVWPRVLSFLARL